MLNDFIDYVLEHPDWFRINYRSIDNLTEIIVRDNANKKSLSTQLELLLNRPILYYVIGVSILYDKKVYHIFDGNLDNMNIPIDYIELEYVKFRLLCQ